MSHEEIAVRTQDGTCPVHVFTPREGSGPWPAVIFCMDGLAIRPALIEMGQRMADGGFVVLLPDLFYRAGPYEPLDPKVIFAGGSVREKLGALISTTDTRRAAQDAAAFLAHIDSRSDVKGRKVGTTGYCMGGGIALAIAGTYPDRIAAAASFHGGNLATDEPTSPHLFAPKIKARVYIGVADNDASYPPEMAEQFESALADAGVDYRSELYEGALHGWTMTDFPIYDEPAAERHWRELFKLFGETLG